MRYMQFTEKQFTYAKLSWHGQSYYSAADYERAYKRYDFLYNKLLPADKAASILEVGCAGGKFLNYLKRKGYANHFGIDIYPDAIEQCRNGITPNVSVEDVFEHSKSHVGSYDVIVCNHVIEHFTREGSIDLLSALYKSLRPNGRVIVATPNASTPWAGYHRFHDLTHDHLYTAQSLQDSLMYVGFTNISIHEETPVPYGGLATLRYGLWLARRAYLKFMFMVEISAGYYQPTDIIVAPGIIGLGFLPEIES
jgi:2-polyprenyl-3-methyl-5-hydroxy-6-metoxy-1,4-benzoquinol methylase